MKFLFCFTLFIISFQSVHSQTNNFIYLQSELSTPFYTIVNGKNIISSTPNGYVTIPKLTSGVYELEIGFAKNKYPEQHFEIELSNTDLGYYLRKINDSVFNLINIQTNETISKKSNAEILTVETIIIEKQSNQIIPESTNKAPIKASTNNAPKRTAKRSGLTKKENNKN
jgi:hypothetical protein